MKEPSRSLMKFLADINIPQSAIKALHSLGHDIKDGKKHFLESPDSDLVRAARKEKRIILTLDKDFITLTQFPKYQVATIVIRLKNQNPKQLSNYLIELLENQSIDILQNSLTILTEESADSYSFRA